MSPDPLPTKRTIQFKPPGCRWSLPHPSNICTIFKFCVTNKEVLNEGSPTRRGFETTVHLFRQGT